MSRRPAAREGVVLALDGATEYLTLAAATDTGRTLGSRTTHLGREHAARLPAELEAFLVQVGRERQDLSRICVGTGPGSYTGIRVTVAFAKGLARALGVPLVGASSLIAVGGPHLSPGASGVAILDARRGNCYAQVLKREPEGGETLGARRGDGPAQVSNRESEGGESVPLVTALGSPVKTAREELAAAFGGLETLPEGPPDAIYLCAHALRHRAGADAPVPLYL